MAKYDLFANMRKVLGTTMPSQEMADVATDAAMANKGMQWYHNFFSQFGSEDPAKGDDPPGFDWLNELEKEMAKYSYSASRHAYAPFFSQKQRGGQRNSRWGGSGKRGDPPPAPTLAPQQSPFKGMAQALGASPGRTAPKPGSLAAGRRPSPTGGF